MQPQLVPALSQINPGQQGINYRHLCPTTILSKPGQQLYIMCPRSYQSRATIMDITVLYCTVLTESTSVYWPCLLELTLFQGPNYRHVISPDQEIFVRTIVCWPSELLSQCVSCQLYLCYKGQVFSKQSSVSYPQPSQATEPSQAKCKLQAKLQAKLQEEGILYTFLTPW